MSGRKAEGSIPGQDCSASIGESRVRPGQISMSTVGLLITVQMTVSFGSCAFHLSLGPRPFSLSLSCNL